MTRPRLAGAIGLARLHEYAKQGRAAVSRALAGPAPQQQPLSRGPHTDPTRPWVGRRPPGPPVQRQPAPGLPEEAPARRGSTASESRTSFPLSLALCNGGHKEASSESYRTHMGKRRDAVALELAGCVADKQGSRRLPWRLHWNAGIYFSFVNKRLQASCDYYHLQPLTYKTQIFKNKTPPYN
ncbi:uncharacterized protein [Chlorocebus sabaeus]|uniref:uncharacterized protein isoform X2 n=1 Tax=Chlorocebus sabaeus TaxID=60711 RepID=UPI003BF97225